MSSKKVFLKCSRAFVHGQIKSKEALEHLSRASRGIGAYYANKHSTRRGTGLNEEELKLLLPQVLDIHPNDLEFRKKIEKFYEDINTIVPYERGLEVEIGLELDNDKPVTYFEEREGDTKAYNTPINFDDYVRYRHAIAHPWVAATPEAAKGNGTYSFYAEDPSKVSKAKVGDTEIMDEAILTYTQIKTDKSKTKMILTLMYPLLEKKKIGEVIIVSSLSDEDKILQLRYLASKYPKQFQDNATDINLKNRYQLSEFIRVNLVKRVGSSLIVTESGLPLGANEEESVATLFHNPANAQLLGLFRAHMLDLATKE